MKRFEIPEVEIVYFEIDVVTASCKCVDCGVCPTGDHCQKYDDL